MAAAAVTTGQVNILLSSFLHANQDHVVDLNLFFNLDICADLHLGSFGETACESPGIMCGGARYRGRGQCVPAFTGIFPISCGSKFLNFSCWPMFADKCFTYSKDLYTSTIEAAILETGIHWFSEEVQKEMRKVATILNTVVHA